MHTNAANGQRFSYANVFGRGGSIARSTAKIFMAALMIFGVANSAQGAVEQVAPASSQLICSSTFCNDEGRYYDGVPPFPYSKKYTYESAQAWCSFAKWTYINPAPYGGNSFLAFYNCGDFGFSLFSASCPVPTVNPGVRYTLNTSSGMCEREVAVCPTNASRPSPDQPCVCDVGYQFDAADTSCIPIKLYTISLSGLGGELAPSASRAAYAEVMEGATAKSGIAVTLKTTAPTEAGTAILSPANGTTGGDGKLNFTFTAPPVGGTHTVTATCDGGKCSNQDSGTVVVTACKIPPLTPMTEQVALDFENPANRWQPQGLTPDYQNKLKCVQDGIDAKTGVTGSYTGTSAYRPFQYQRHLFEIVAKDLKLNTKYMKLHPECRARRDEISRKMGPEPQGHALKRGQDVAIPGSSRHESRTAFDLTPKGLSKAQMKPIYAGCGVTNTKVKNEPWHVQ